MHYALGPLAVVDGRLVIVMIPMPLLSPDRPGEYGVPRNPMSRSYPAFTFRGVTPKDAKAKLPGPGAYEAINPDCLSMRARWVRGNGNWLMVLSRKY